jgi:hypothetical protein
MSKSGSEILKNQNMQEAYVLLKNDTRLVPEVPDLTKKKKHFGKKCLYFST